jgi:Glutathione S-transferase, N-terminal domain
LSSEEFLAETPMGQLPMLEVDGKQLCQSNAMNRYLANKFGRNELSRMSSCVHSYKQLFTRESDGRFAPLLSGLAGKDAWESARCDMLSDGLNDLMNKFHSWWDEEDAKKKVRRLRLISSSKYSPR